MAQKIFFVLVVLLLCVFPLEVFGEISIGVKEGDWVEYDVSTTGSPPTEHDVVWARMDVIGVVGSDVTVDVTTEVENGTISNQLMTLKLEEGQIGAWWIIPANLGPEDTFYDAFLNSTITINGQEQLVYAGVERTVTNATVPGRIKRWDKETGAFLVSMDDFSDYTIDVIAQKTNLWSSTILGMASTTFYSITFIFAVVFILVGVLLFKKTRK